MKNHVILTAFTIVGLGALSGCGLAGIADDQTDVADRSIPSGFTIEATEEIPVVSQSLPAGAIPLAGITLWTWAACENGKVVFAAAVESDSRFITESTSTVSCPASFNSGSFKIQLLTPARQSENPGRGPLLFEETTAQQAPPPPANSRPDPATLLVTPTITKLGKLPAPPSSEPGERPEGPRGPAIITWLSCVDGELVHSVVLKGGPQQQKKTSLGTCAGAMPVNAFEITLTPSN